MFKLLKGNKGEWSEVYAFLRLLAVGKIFAADKNLHKLEDVYFPILWIIRTEEQDEIKKYEIGQVVSIYVNSVKVKELNALEFACEADFLLEELQHEQKQAAFTLEKIQEFLDKILCYRLSAPTTDKSDINIKIVDIHTGFSPEVGFSIKSELGKPPTLLNAGKTTNFIYQVESDPSNLQRLLFEKHAIRVLVQCIYDHGCLRYFKMQNQTFRDNLELIDSQMEQILAQTLLYFYRDNIKSCEDIVAALERDNPMNYGNVHAYRYKFKKFLSAVALGMKPATVWNGRDEASGGYIVVRKDGEVLAYHIYNRNEFEEYLLTNTKYETASTSRHDFGQVYEKDGKAWINLNLQIRFKNRESK